MSTPAPSLAKASEAERAARKPLIELENIQKYYGDYHALRGITATIRQGEFFSLLGPSGCGKT
ncbi:MAG: Fe3+/spermidine/putrescine ABC transporter ATP-binding protein, partial [Rhodobacterales bacterium]|nr:Fe3+/spermidine/putrescine ABC transporter ATP-binding protein [Rhodobacterales bacterium]MDX5400875.1 Fe3+/spermidine/putrescine ABC transporter ATP-binding protein [Rhodobacterales bacterium]